MCWWSEELCGKAPDAIDLRLSALGELLRKQEKLVAPAGAAPPRQADLSLRTIRLQRSVMVAEVSRYGTDADDVGGQGDANAR